MLTSVEVLFSISILAATVPALFRAEKLICLTMLPSSSNLYDTLEFLNTLCLSVSERTIL